MGTSFPLQEETSTPAHTYSSVKRCLIFLCSLHPFSKHPGPSTRFSAPSSQPSFSLHLCLCSLYPCPMHPFPCNLVLSKLFSEPLFYFLPPLFSVHSSLDRCSIFLPPLFFAHCSLDRCSIFSTPLSLPPVPCTVPSLCNLIPYTIVPQHPVTCSVALTYAAPVLVLCSLHSFTKCLFEAGFKKYTSAPSRLS